MGKRAKNKWAAFPAAVMTAVVLIMSSGCAGGDNNGTNEEQRTEETKADLFENDELFDENGGVKQAFSTGFGYLNGPAFAGEGNVVNAAIYMDTGIEAKRVDMGLMVFIDGMLQPVSVNGKEACSINIIDVNGYTEYTIAFEPISGTAGQSVRMDVMSLLHPLYEVTENTKSFGNCFMSSSLYPKYIECRETAENIPGASEYRSEEIPEDIAAIYSDKDNIEGSQNMSMYIEYYQKGEKTDRLRTENGRLAFDMKICGGICEENNIYVFLDNKLLSCFGGKDYSAVNITRDSMTVLSAEADVSDAGIGSYSQLFVIAVPAGNVSNAGICKFTNVIVEN